MRDKPDWCIGCETPEPKRINLPEGWAVGDPVPEGLTMHHTAREAKGPFAFRGSPANQDRVYFSL